MGNCCRPDLSIEKSNELGTEGIVIIPKCEKSRAPRQVNSPAFNKPLFDPKYIRDDEKEFITYTKNGILAFINELNGYQYQKMFEKDGLIVHVRKDGSAICPSYFLGKAEYTIPKSSFIAPVTQEDFVRILYNPQERLKWDKGIKSIDIVDKISESAFISRSFTNRIMMIISERDFIDKKVEFYLNDAYYNFQSSVPDETFPTQEDAVRVRTYLNAFILTDDSDNFYITYYNQVDIKMNIPQKMIEMTVPMQLQSWYKKAINAVNENLKAKLEQTK